MADCHDRAMGSFVDLSVAPSGRRGKVASFIGAGSTGGQHQNREDGSSQEQKMKCWRWLLIALVLVALPTTGMAAGGGSLMGDPDSGGGFVGGRTAQSSWADGGGSLMGDPDGGSGGFVGNSGQGGLHDFRVRHSRSNENGMSTRADLWSAVLRLLLNR